MEIKRVGVASAAMIVGALNALMGLLLGVCFALLSAIGLFGAAPDAEMPAAMAALFGFGAVLIMPLFYGVLGVVFGALAAAVYNVVAGMIGGLRLEVVQA